MYRRNMLQWELVRNGKLVKDLRDFLGISAPTMTQKMKTGNFTREQIEAMADWLNIEDVRPIFFYREVPDEQNS